MVGRRRKRRQVPELRRTFVIVAIALGILMAVTVAMRGYRARRSAPQNSPPPIQDQEPAEAQLPDAEESPPAELEVAEADGTSNDAIYQEPPEDGVETDEPPPSAHSSAGASGDATTL